MIAEGAVVCKGDVAVCGGHGAPPQGKSRMDAFLLSGVGLWEMSWQCDTVLVERAVSGAILTRLWKVWLVIC